MQQAFSLESSENILFLFSTTANRWCHVSKWNPVKIDKNLCFVKFFTAWCSVVVAKATLMADVDETSALEKGLKCQFTIHEAFKARLYTPEKARQCYGCGWRRSMCWFLQMQQLPPDISVRNCKKLLSWDHTGCATSRFSKIDKESIHFDNQSTTERLLGTSIEWEKGPWNQNISNGRSHPEVTFKRTTTTRVTVSVI